MDQELGVASVDYRDIKVMIKTPVTTKVFFFFLQSRCKTEEMVYCCIE